MPWYFLGYFSRISDGHPYPFYPEVPPPREQSRAAQSKANKVKWDNILLLTMLVNTF